MAIQAGGVSSRMGQDKGLLPFGQALLVEHIINQIKPLGYEIYVISNSPEDYKFLGLPVYSDVHEGIGALAGIHTILTYARSEYVLALACDMPYVELGLIRYLIELSSNHDIVIPSIGNQGFLEPFRAVYSRKCLASVEDAIRIGKRKVISFFDGLDVVQVSPEKIHQFDPEERSFLNINTPQDYKRLVAEIDD